ncbi:MAG: MurR/RpiR family transcriptional regulator [Pseudomonadota bacterium]
MNGTNVSSRVLDRLSEEWDALTPEAQKAARYVLENPADVGVSTVREIAEAAGVKPNTLVRMARCAGFEGWEDFRAPFRDQIREGTASFPDRARWLQSLGQGGKLAGLYADMAESAIRNIETTFAATDPQAMKAAADAVVAARHCFILGVGANHTLARSFAYLAGQALDTVWPIPRDGSTAVDDLSRAGAGDVLIAITCKPYRTEVIEAVDLARTQGVTIIGISDSPASPLILGSEHGFIVSAETPQFFPSTVAIGAVLETLIAFVIADAPPAVIENIDRFHARRHALGIYREDAT